MMRPLCRLPTRETDVDEYLSSDSHHLGTMSVLTTKSIVVFGMLSSTLGTLLNVATMASEKTCHLPCSEMAPVREGDVLSERPGEAGEESSPLVGTPFIRGVRCIGAGREKGSRKPFHQALFQKALSRIGFCLGNGVVDGAHVSHQNCQLGTSRDSSVQQIALQNSAIL